MKTTLCALVIAVALAGCDGKSVTGVDEAPVEESRRPGVASMAPMCVSLYRVGGTHDPGSPDYDPAVPDTALMHYPCTLVWSGRDPNGVCETLLYKWGVDAGAPSEWSPDTSAIVDDLTSAAHEFFVVPGCPQVSGIRRGYEFVVNFDPDSELISPAEPSGMTAADDDTLWVRVAARDREALEGVGGGVAQIAVELDHASMTFDCPPDTAVWWWSSSADPASDHYIESVNHPEGGNAIHTLRVFAVDVDGRWETPSPLLEDRETFFFWFNFPPTSSVTYPADGDTVGSELTITWEGSDVDGEVEAYQYALDPAVNPYVVTDAAELRVLELAPGGHEFRVRARDNSGCWQEGWVIVGFYVE